jgi:ATP-dependent exoDNAse (exonuclease V) beta subunit
MFVDDPSVKPGLHAPQTGPHEVVWWDPRTLRLAVEMDVGLRQQDILAETDSNESQERYKAWRARREEAIRNGERKQYDIFTPSEAADSPPGVEIAIAFETIDRPPDRPFGPRFGTLVHTMMRDVPFTAGRAIVDRLARSHGRLLGASAEEVTGASDAVARALGHPLVQRAAAAERCYRELPVTLRTDDDRMLEGVIDLAFVETGRWTILDFKTDADLSAKREHYMPQLRWYALALSRLTGESVTACLLAL